jgi:RimJ/RimL family protein N-acetyltransferase
MQEVSMTMHELEPGAFARARGLFSGFDYSLSVEAAIEGNNPGRIFVDDADAPRTALALTVEGYLLAGDYHNPETVDALRCLFRDRIFSGEVFVNGDWSMSLAVHPESWEARLPALIPTHEAERSARYHYLCQELALDWRQHLPEGYTVRRVDPALWHDPGVHFPESVREWIDLEEVWGTEENFFAKGVSFAVLHGDEVVAWCTPDCVAGDRIDVGIFTLPAHRRTGLATVAVAATVEQCLRQGFRAVGWHCNADNVGSWKTAERVGFARNREYVYYYYIYDPVDHLAELGWYHYRQGDYAQTVHYYEQVFAQREDNPDYYYHLAALAWAHLGNQEKALQHLQSAADHGWGHAEWTRQQEAFAILHGMPAWDAVLAQMEESTK